MPRLVLYFNNSLTTPVYVPLPPAADTLWHNYSVTQATPTGDLTLVSLEVTSPTALANYRLNLGQLQLGTAAAPVAPVAAFTANSTTVLTGQSVQFANASTNATSYVWTFVGGTPASSTAVHPVLNYATAGTYAVTLQATGPGGQNSTTRTAYITVTTAPPAGRNTSLRFDGSSKYAEAGTINLSGAAISLECWVKANSFKTTNPFISSLLGIENGGSSTAELRLGDANIGADQVQFALQVGNAVRKLTSLTRLTAGTWYHVAATYDGTSMKLYLNGVLDNTLAATGTVTANAPFSLGRNNSSPRILDGWLDELRAWTRALTPAEIVANACLVAPNAPGLAGYWRCNDSPALAAADASGQGHNAAFQGLTAADWSLDVPLLCGPLGSGNSQAARAALQVLPLQNPVAGAQAEVQVHGTYGQPVTLTLFNCLGAVLWTKQIRFLADTEGAAGGVAERSRAVFAASSHGHRHRHGTAVARVARVPRSYTLGYSSCYAAFTNRISSRTWFKNWASSESLAISWVIWRVRLSWSRAFWRVSSSSKPSSRSRWRWVAASAWARR